jgi:hypothetical protein
MEPLDEKELKQLLRQWEAPAAPPTLKARVLPAKAPWWNWLLSGSVRVPVPVALAAALLLALWIYHSRPATGLSHDPQPQTVSLSDFKPVKQLEPVLVSGGQK